MTPKKSVKDRLWEKKPIGWINRKILMLRLQWEEEAQLLREILDAPEHGFYCYDLPEVLDNLLALHGRIHAHLEAQRTLEEHLEVVERPVQSDLGPPDPDGPKPLRTRLPKRAKTV